MGKNKRTVCVAVVLGIVAIIATAFTVIRLKSLAIEEAALSKMGASKSEAFYTVRITDHGKELDKISCTLNAFDRAYLDGRLQLLNENGEDRVYPEIMLDKNGLSISKYRDGASFDTKKLGDFIYYNFGRENFSVDISRYEVSYGNEMMPSEKAAELSEKIAPYIDFKIGYVFGESITLADFTRFVSLEGEGVVLKFDREDFDEYVEELVKEKVSAYDTYYGEWEFKSTNRGTVKVTSDPKAYCGSTYGSKVNYAKEIEYVKNALLNLESEEGRVPELSLNNGLEIPSTYVEVSIEDQHLWYYVDGELTMDSNVVTGCVANGTDTPVGVYQISSMCHGIAFQGGASGRNWMQFTARGHGLHDATWRPASDFESAETYLSNGSHGCVNLPLDFSGELYNAVSVGTVVVVY